MKDCQWLSTSLILSIWNWILTSPECMGLYPFCPSSWKCGGSVCQGQASLSFWQHRDKKSSTRQYCSFVIRVLWQLWRFVARLETFPRLSYLTHSLPLGRHYTFFITVWYWRVAAGDEGRMAITACLLGDLSLFTVVWKTSVSFNVCHETNMCVRIHKEILFHRVFSSPQLRPTQKSTLKQTTITGALSYHTKV